MDFDVTKENIQPLRGGRNVQQLGMALQAQTNRDLQQQLLHQREEFENAIRNYEGDDPLENYYQYISWVEQSYPKNGHEGNLFPLLEHCLKKFEDDQRYYADRRFCKLWIKYIDMTSNPIEMYQMVHAKGICIGCADLYRAWAYYHEAVGDFQSAHKVFEAGKQALAQPYDELDQAHKSLVMAAGQHMLYGRNENLLVQKRQALTSLHTFGMGRVSNVRTASSSSAAPVVVPNSNTRTIPNASIQVFEERGAASLLASNQHLKRAEAAPNSIILAARRDEAPKENVLKPGPWTTCPVTSKKIPAKVETFTIHEDGADNDVMAGIKLPPNHAKETFEDYSKWRVSICTPDPDDPTKIPQYPKDRVYIDLNTEYSLEELRSQRYRSKSNLANLSNNNNNLTVQKTLTPTKNQSLVDVSPKASFVIATPVMDRLNATEMQVPQISFHMAPNKSSMFLQPFRISDSVNIRSTPSTSSRGNPPGNNSPFGSQSGFMGLPPPTTTFNMTSTSNQIHIIDEDDDDDDDVVYPLKSDKSTSSATPNFNNLQPQAIPQFKIYEESLQEMSNLKGSAMKTTPIQSLNADDIVETGSRGGMDIAATAQPTECAKRMEIFEDSSASESGSSPVVVPSVTNSETTFACNTQIFNINLNTMNVSTPKNLKKEQQEPLEDIPMQVNDVRKQLFSEPNYKFLSTIKEETKSYESSSSSNGTKSSLINQRTKLSNISEEHTSYLSQNMMANAELRRSLLGPLINDNAAITPTIPSISNSSNDTTATIIVPASPVEESVNVFLGRKIPTPADVRPLATAPSNPFRSSFINELLERVQFPGPHSDGYKYLYDLPRLSVRKEPITIGSDQYVMEKQLGKGSFGTVWKGYHLMFGTNVALKYQKPANKWEFYICRELQARLKDHPLRDRFMDVTIGYFSPQSSILVSNFMPHGSLLDIANLYKQKLGRIMKEPLCIYFASEMLRIIEAMHSAKIIHADIKPDNFLAYLLPDNSVSLQLIDFGCSIDMSLFPPGTTFTCSITTENFICCEIRDGRPWSYHTDLFCVAATAHVLLFDKYIVMNKKNGMWSITNRLPRYARIDLWNMFFSTLLNQQNGPADTKTLLSMLDDTLASVSTDFTAELRSLVNLLKNR